MASILSASVLISKQARSTVVAGACAAAIPSPEINEMEISLTAIKTNNTLLCEFILCTIYDSQSHSYYLLNIDLWELATHG